MDLTSLLDNIETIFTKCFYASVNSNKTIVEPSDSMTMISRDIPSLRNVILPPLASKGVSNG